MRELSREETGFDCKNLPSIFKKKNDKCQKFVSLDERFLASMDVGTIGEV